MVNMPTTPPATHSPLPWRLHYCEIDKVWEVLTSDSLRCIVRGLDEETSALIVAACNAHAASEARIAKLEEALRLAKNRITEMANAQDLCWLDWNGAYYVDAALASVGETP